MRTQRQFKMAGALPIVVVTAVFPLGVEAAEDAKSYSAAFCHLDSDSDATYDFVDGAMKVATNSPETAHVVCPLVRDNVGSTNGIRSVWVEIIHAQGLTACTLYTLPEDQAKGSYVDWTQAFGGGLEIPGLPGVADGFQQVNFNASEDNLPETSGGNEGAYVLTCGINPGNTLQQITLTEN